MKSQLWIFATLKESALRKTSCIVSFFEKEILLTTIDAGKKKQLVEARRTEIRDAGGNRLKASLAGLAALSDYAAVIGDMEHEGILKETTRTIPAETVRKITFKAAGEIRSMDNMSSARDPGKLLFRLPDGRVSLSHTETDPAGRIAAYLKSYGR